MAGPGSHFAGPLLVGPKKDPDAFGPANFGLAQLIQTLTLQANSNLTVTGQFNLPPGAVIHDLILDTTVTWTATTALFSLGLTAGGTDFSSGTSLISTGTPGRSRPSGVTGVTQAQLAAWQNLNGATGSNIAIFATVTSTGPTAVGTTFVQLEYIMNIEQLDSYF